MYFSDSILYPLILQSRQINIDLDPYPIGYDIFFDMIYSMMP